MASCGRSADREATFALVPTEQQHSPVPICSTISMPYRTNCLSQNPQHVFPMLAAWGGGGAVACSRRAVSVHVRRCKNKHCDCVGMRF